MPYSEYTYPAKEEVDYLLARIKSGDCSTADLEHAAKVLRDSGFYEMKRKEKKALLQPGQPSKS